MSQSPRQAFAADLDAARRRLHLSIRDVARLADVPTATVQGWLNGKHLPVPALRANYLRMAERLGLADQVPDALWGETWSDVAPRLRTDAAPYLGLRPFSASDATLFFGREHESRRLAETIREAGGPGLVVVIGASGSGKSSLLAAGLIGKEAVTGVLAGWSVAQVAVADLAGSKDLVADLVVVDQFEDTFTLAEDVRVAALAALTELAGRGAVVLGLRADAFAAAAAEPLLAEALSRPFLVTPLTREEARQVVVGPAELAGVKVEDDLVPVLLDDLLVGGAVAPDVLPLLSNALLVTWAGGSGDRMTLADYVRAGGISSAILGLAEEVYASLDAAQQEAAKRLFLRLVRTSGDVLVRAEVPLDDIDPAGLTAMDAFVAARMLTVSGHAVRISHEALLSHWTRLQDWVGEARDDLAVAARLQRAAQVWHESDRSPDALIPVDRLEVLSDWVANPGHEELLSPREAEFVAASRSHFTSVLAAEKQVTRKLRRGRSLAIGLTALATGLALVTGFLYWQGRGLQAQADSSRLDAQSRQVALEARSTRSDDPNLMAQMSLVASDLAPTRQSQSALLDATSVNTPLRWLGHGGAVLAKSADESLLARADGTGGVTLWRAGELTTSPGTSFVADPSGAPLYALAIATTGGRTLLAVGGGGATGLWDVTAEPKLLADLRAGDLTTYGVAFNPAGDRLAVATSAGAVELWSIAGDEVRHVSRLTDNDQVPAKAVSFGPTGDDLFVAGRVNAVAHWRLGQTPKRLADLAFSYDDKQVISQTLALNPAGTELAAGVAGRRIFRWRLGGAEPVALEPLLGFDSWTNDLAYSPDGGTLLAANSDQHVYLFDSATGAVRQRLGGPALMTGVELFGDRPVSADASGSVLVWQARNPVLRTGSSVYALSTDASGEWLAASTLADGIELWRSGQPNPVRLPDPAAQGRALASAVAFAPNGAFLLGGTTDGSVLSWPLTDAGAGEPRVVDAFPGSYIGALAVSPDASLAAVLQYTGTKVALYRLDASGVLTPAATLDTPVPQGVSFSPDGQLLAVPIDAKVVQLWDVTDPAAPRLAGLVEGFGTMPSMVSFANHSRTLAVGTDTGKVSVWDVTDPAHPAQRHGFGDGRSGIYGLNFAPDDQRLAAVGGDGLVWLWRLDGPDSEAYLALDGELGHTNDVRFIDGGASLAVGGDNGTLRTWVSDLGRAHDELCANRGDVLSPEEWARYLPGVPVADPC